MSRKSKKAERTCIKFNMNAVPRRKRNNETLLEMVDEYAAKLKDKGWRQALCIHESAHALYAERFGSWRATFEAELSFEYDKSGDAFVFHQASVLADTPRRWRDDAKYMLAGKVVEHAFVDSKHRDDYDPRIDGYDDRSDDAYILKALKRGRVPTAKWPSLIKRIESEIRRDLRRPAFREALLRRAKSYQRILEDTIYANREPAREQEAA